jgi:hypothetical protein
MLDKKFEHTPLQAEEIDIKQCLNNRLVHLLREEEIKWYQRAKRKNLLEGDSNTKYLQLIASRKYRKTRIFQLHEDTMIEEEQTLKEYITSYYRDLLGPPKRTSFSLDESRMADIVQVSQEENDLIIRPFTCEEIRESIF